MSEYYNNQDQQQTTQQVTSNGVPVGWDDEVEERKAFVLLPEGDYDFRVESFERETFNGNERTPACNVANLHLIIDFNGEDVKLDKKLYMLSTNGQLFAFFRSIGTETLPNGNIKMNWQRVPGATGRCSINHRKYNGNEYNNIKAFIPKEVRPTHQQQTQQQTTYQQPNMNGYVHPNYQQGKW